MPKEWKWTPRATNQEADPLAEPVTIKRDGCDSEGRNLFYIDAPGGLTLEELQAFAVWLVGDFRRSAT